jgi:PD-(D/E)XK nuclease superfamily
MSDSIVVSHSEVDIFNSCQRKHFYSFVDGLEPKQFGSPIRRGVLGHAALAEFFTGPMKGFTYEESLDSMHDFLDLKALREPESRDVIGDVSRITDGWLRSFKSRIINWEILYVEHEFWLNISDRIRYPFKPDLVIKEQNRIKVIDYKFCYDFFSSDELALFPQLPKYIGALRALGIYAQDGLYAELRYRSLKNPSPEDLYRLTPIPLNNARIKRTWLEQIEGTQRIAQRKELPYELSEEQAVRSASKSNCRWCWFKNLCSAELQGSDGRLMRQVEFIPTTYGYVETEQ